MPDPKMAIDPEGLTGAAALSVELWLRLLPARWPGPTSTAVQHSADHIDCADSPRVTLGPRTTRRR